MSAIQQSISSPFENSLLADKLEKKTTLLPPGDPLLSTSVPEVPEHEICSLEIQEMIDDLLETAEKLKKQGQTLFGLAAPQIGRKHSIIIVVRNIDENPSNFKAYINPRIIKYSNQGEDIESCFSVDSRIRGIVQRAGNITIKAFDRKGKYIEEELTGFRARIFQHAVEHTKGERFPDIVEKSKNLHWIDSTEYKEYSEYRKAKRPWPRIVSKEIWHTMKEGKEFTPPPPLKVFCQEPSANS